MNLIKDNIVIRNAEADDAQQLCAWWNDGKVMAHAGYYNGLGLTADEVCKGLISDDDETQRHNIIELNGKPIGEMNYRNEGGGAVEIGIKICDFSEQNRGLGTKLLTMFIDALFTYCGYEKIILDTNMKNERARHVYEKKLGFKPARTREALWAEQLGGLQTFIDYELTKKDWVSQQTEAVKYIHLRLERPADYRAVEEITREAFWEFWEADRKVCDEHLLVHKLRNAVGFVPELDFVAETDGKLVGHIIYSKSKIMNESGKEHEALIFGPLTVLPEYQSKGVGKALMLHSFRIARRLGFRAVIIFGHPDYYPRVGFRRAAEFDITTDDGKNFDAFMALPLYDGALDGISGRYYIDPVYSQLTQEEALEFDKRFPYKEPYISTPIDVLLNRLEPAARKEIENLDKKTIECFNTMSERSIRALPGITESDIETIRAVIKELGHKWGER